VTRELNLRPRKTLDCDTPAARFKAERTALAAALGKPQSTRKTTRKTRICCVDRQKPPNLSGDSFTGGVYANLGHCIYRGFFAARERVERVSVGDRIMRPGQPSNPRTAA
jgi:hypothetical protein